jgi:hypothetical protein
MCRFDWLGSTNKLLLSMQPKHLGFCYFIILLFYFTFYFIFFFLFFYPLSIQQGKKMKFLEVDSVDLINTAFHWETTECVLTGRVEAYSCKYIYIYIYI